MKKIIFILLFMLIFNLNVHASSTTQAKIGGKYYDSLTDAINALGENETLTLMSNVKLDEGLDINKTVNIDLNGNNIVAPTAVFKVKGGKLNITGKGTIKESEPNYGVIRVIGSDTPSDEKYSYVTIGKNVTLEGWSGVFITHESNKSHDVYVDVLGNINAVSDTNGDSGIGIYVNGNIKHKDNAPTVNVIEGANISSNGTGLYIAGYSTFNIKDANITGVESAIGIKSGILHIDGNSNLRATGSDKTPTEGYNNGLNPSGTTIQIESNNGYAGNIEIDISNGTFTSDNSHTIYEYLGKGTTTQVISMSISNGTFKSSKNVFELSKSFNDIHGGFISGGKYSTDPTKYLKNGYSSNREETYYNVIKSTMNELLTFNETKSSNNILLEIIISILLITGCIFIYLKRNLIINYIKK